MAWIRPGANNEESIHYDWIMATLCGALSTFGLCSLCWTLPGVRLLVQVLEVLDGDDVACISARRRTAEFMCMILS